MSEFFKNKYEEMRGTTDYLEFDQILLGKDWIKLNNNPLSFEAWKVVAGHLSALIAWDKKNKILILQNLSNSLSPDSPYYDKDQKPEGDARMIDLIFEFCKNRPEIQQPKLVIMRDVVEKGIVSKFSSMGGDGHKTSMHVDYKTIMDSKLGKLAGKMGHVVSIYLSGSRDSKAMGSKGPRLVFLY